MLLRYLWPREDEYRRRACMITQAARWRRISEYTLFRQAYERYYGKTPAEPQLERLFVRFLYSGQLPRWVEEYAQSVIEQAWREDPSTIPLGKRVFAIPGVLRCVALSWWLSHHRTPDNGLFA